MCILSVDENAGIQMITRKMFQYLEEYSKSPNQKRTVKHCVYINRMQKRIDKELDMLFKLANKFPEVFLDRAKEYTDDTGTIVSHRRLKKLLLSVKLLNPKMEVELVLKNLEFPDENDVT